MDSSSSDEDDFFFDSAHVIAEDSLNQPLHRGSIEGHLVVNRERHSWHFLLYQDYFSDNPTIGPKYFRRRREMQLVHSDYLVYRRWWQHFG
ncbi:hypothetical protein PR202_gb07712 [Eleusine coracana subsp. coracana]|uniref:Uncharacterized protein n=1 Tax=Eleusine coracana subsp. coracana TaxID=191504 RepID=A0AAV5EC85_ELECO|nr:hypothetical protein PR202_gb07712 [Eleusine coracana subsp. coracana]